MDLSSAPIRSPLADAPAISPVRSKKRHSKKMKLRKKSMDYLSSRLDNSSNNSSQINNPKNIVQKSILDSSDDDFSSDDDGDCGYTSDDNYTTDINRVISNGALNGDSSGFPDESGEILVPESPAKQSSILQPEESALSLNQINTKDDDAYDDHNNSRSQDKGFLSGFLSIVGNQISSIGSTVKDQVNSSIQTVENKVDILHHNNSRSDLNINEINSPVSNADSKTNDDEIVDENGNLITANDAVKDLHFKPVSKDNGNSVLLEDSKQKEPDIIDTLGQGNLSLSDFLEPKDQINNNKSNPDAKSEASMDSSYADGINIGVSPSKIMTNNGYHGDLSNNKIIGMPQDHSTSNIGMSNSSSIPTIVQVDNAQRNSKYASNNHSRNNSKQLPVDNKVAASELNSPANTNTLVNKLQNLKDLQQISSNNHSFNSTNKIKTPPNESNSTSHLSPPAAIMKTPSFLVSSVSNNNSLRTSPVNYRFQTNMQSISTPASPSHPGVIPLNSQLGANPTNKLSTIQQGVATNIQLSQPSLSSGISKSNSTSRLVPSSFPSKAMPVGSSSLTVNSNDNSADSDVKRGKSLSFSRNSLSLCNIPGLNGTNKSATTKSRSNSYTEAAAAAALPSSDSSQYYHNHYRNTIHNYLTPYLSPKFEQDENTKSSNELPPLPTTKITNVVDVEPQVKQDDAKDDVKDEDNENENDNAKGDGSIDVNNNESTSHKPSIKRIRSSRLSKSGRKKGLKVGNNSNAAPTGESSNTVSRLHRRHSHNRRRRNNKKLKLEFASDRKQKEFHSTFRDIPQDEKLFTDFACALSKDILLQGRIWISEKHISFHSNILSYVTDLTIPLEEIVQIEKKFTAGFIPNALQIRTLQAKYFFTSFISRDTSFEIINKVWTDAAKSRISIQPDSDTDFDSNSDDDSAEDSELESDDDDDDDSDNSSTQNSDYDAAADSGISDSEMDQISDLENMTDGSDDDSIDNDDDKEENGNKSNSPDADGSNGPSSRGSGNNTADTENVNNGLGSLPVFGPLKHPMAKSPWIKKNNEVEIRTETFPVPPGTIYMLLFGDSSGDFVTKLLSKSKNFNISEISGFKKNPDNDLKERKYSYIKPLGGPVGPKQTKCNITETIEKVDLETEGNIQVLQVTHSPDVPSGNSFLVYTRFYLTWAENNGTMMQVITWVEWSGKSWIKSAVENGSIKGQKESAQMLVDTINDEISTNLSKNKKSGKKSSTKKSGKKLSNNGNRSKSKPRRQSASNNESSNAENAVDIENIGIINLFLILIKKLIDLIPIPFVSVELKGIIVFVILLFIWLVKKFIGRGSPTVNPILDNYILIPISSKFYARNEIKAEIQNNIWNWIDDRTN